jgi:chromosomal replication initiation ATPase DnaA
MMTPRQISYAGIRRICDEHKMSREELLSGMTANVCRVRRKIAFYLHHERGLSTNVIAEMLNRDHSSVVSMLRRYAEEAAA